MSEANQEVEVKCCPFSMARPNGPVDCYGSACMAWREKKENKGTSYYPDWKPTGYCGLAGKP